MLTEDPQEARKEGLYAGMTAALASSKFMSLHSLFLWD